MGNFKVERPKPGVVRIIEFGPGKDQAVDVDEQQLLRALNPDALHARVDGRPANIDYVASRSPAETEYRARIGNARPHWCPADETRCAWHDHELCPACLRKERDGLKAQRDRLLRAPTDLTVQDTAMRACRALEIHDPELAAELRRAIEEPAIEPSTWPRTAENVAIYNEGYRNGERETADRMQASGDWGDGMAQAASIVAAEAAQPRPRSLTEVSANLRSVANHYPGRPRVPLFEDAWAEKVKEGYQYGQDALEQVRFGWELRDAYGKGT